MILPNWPTDRPKLVSLSTWFLVWLTYPYTFDINQTTFVFDTMNFLKRIAQCFSINEANIKVLSEPNEFYQFIKVNLINRIILIYLLYRWKVKHLKNDLTNKQMRIKLNIYCKKPEWFEIYRCGNPVDSRWYQCGNLVDSSRFENLELKNYYIYKQN